MNWSICTTEWDQQCKRYRDEYCAKLKGQELSVNEATLECTRKYYRELHDELEKRVKHKFVFRSMNTNEKEDEAWQRHAEQVVEETLGNQPTQAIERLEDMVMKFVQDVQQLKVNEKAKPTAPSHLDRTKAIAPQLSFSTFHQIFLFLQIIQDCSIGLIIFIITCAIF